MSSILVRTFLRQNSFIRLPPRADAIKKIAMQKVLEIFLGN